MNRGYYNLRREDVRGFLQPLARITGLRFSMWPPGESSQSLITGANNFCMMLQTTKKGNERCRNSFLSIMSKTRDTDKPVFDLCHALMGQVAVPLKTDAGDLGTIIVCQDLIGKLSEEHKDHIRELAGEVGLEDPMALIRAAEENPVFPRSKLEDIGRFVYDQLVEKAVSLGAIQDTTEFLLEKYEELMFLYAITDSISPDREYGKALGIILDRGIQKLSAQSGFVILSGEENSRALVTVEVCGNAPWGKGSDNVPLPLALLLRSCSGPAVIVRDPEDDEAWSIELSTLLVCPFRIKSFRNGYLVFGWKTIEDGIDDNDLRFAVALGNQTASLLHGVQLYRELADLLFSTLEALGSAVESKDAYTHGHSQRVADYAVKTARELGYPSRFLTMLKIAGMLHDFGKIGIPERILTKEGKLDDDERRAMKEHPVIGARILGKFKSFVDIVPGIRHHHERFDGSGYPDGLAGEAIPPVGRIIAIADAYDAMTTTRPYRRQMLAHEAQEELRNCSGTQFDPALVQAFVRGNRERTN